MKVIFCIQKSATYERKSPGEAHDAYPELFRLGKTEFDGGTCHALSASESSRDSAGAGTAFEEHDLGDPTAKWPPATIQGDGLCCP